MTTDDTYLPVRRFTQVEIERAVAFMSANPALMADFARRSDGLPVAIGPRTMCRADLLDPLTTADADDGAVQHEENEA